MSYTNSTSATAAPSAGPSTGSSSPGSGGRSTSSNVPSEVLVHWLVIGQLCILALCFIAVFPRAIARFSTYAEWTRGLFLTRGPPAMYNISVRRAQREYKEKGPMYNVDLEGSEESFQSKPMGAMKPYAYPVEIAHSLPSRVRSFASVTHPISSFFMRSVSGVAIGNILLVIAYFAAIGALSFYQREPFSRPGRSGLIAVSQIPAVYAFASKGNLAGMLLGMGYERVCSHLFQPMLFLHSL